MAGKELMHHDVDRSAIGKKHWKYAFTKTFQWTKITQLKIRIYVHQSVFLFVCLMHHVDHSANETLEICVYKNFPVDEN